MVPISDMDRHDAKTGICIVAYEMKLYIDGALLLQLVEGGKM